MDGKRLLYILSIKIDYVLGPFNLGLYGGRFAKGGTNF